MENQFSGAQWWKFDFHTHTPASSDYGKGPQHAILQEKKPREWLIDFMRAEIDCVAVTDHNVGDWIDELKVAYQNLEQELPEEFRKLYLFPGVEIHLADGVHLLAILDPAKSKSDIDQLLGRIHLKRNSTDSREYKTTMSFLNVVAEIKAIGGLAIPAHADADNHGLLSLYANLPILREISQSEDIIAMEVRDPDSLHQLPSIPIHCSAVIGSDSHHPSGALAKRLPGSDFTWIKMGTPSIEGLRLALIDGARLSVLQNKQTVGDPNRYPDVAVEQIEVTNAKYAGNGQALKARFSPWLSAIIGGRGTGKSTLVEMLRLAFRRDRELPDDLHSDLRRFATVSSARGEIGALRNDTEINVLVRKGGRQFRLHWNQKGDNSKAPIKSKVGDNDWKQSPGDIRSRFPVQIFSQRQILSIANNPNSLLEIIDKASELHLSDRKTKRHEIEARFLRLQSRRRELEAKIADRTRIEGELQDVRQQLDVFEKTKHRETLIAYRRSNRHSGIIQSRREEIYLSIDKIRETADDIEPTDLRENEFNSENPAESEAFQFLQESLKIQQDSILSLRRLADEIEQKVAKWSARLESSIVSKEFRAISKNYESLRSQLAQAKISDVSAYDQLIQRRYFLDRSLSELDRIQDEIEETKREANVTLQEASTARSEITKMRRKFLDQVLADNSFVRISVTPFGANAMQQEGSFRKHIARQDDRLEKDILNTDGLSGILPDLYQGLPTDRNSRKSEIERRVSDLKADILKVYQGGSCKRWSKWFSGHIRSLTPEQIDRFLLWWPEDTLAVEYRRPRNEGWASIRHGSPGQRSAALLAFFLSYGNEPIILDQPEDDLDNHLIYDLIVQQIRKSKSSRQLIVATHNPNIVVNGDAEQVLSMDFQKGQCVIMADRSGCLQDQEVRNEICHIMEGGSEAFRSRFKRLGKENQNV